MAALRTILTDSSVWIFNFTDMTFNRSPRIEGGNHPYVQYTGEWMPFFCVEETQALGFQQDRIRFTVYGDDLDNAGSDWITSTYKPAEQHVAD